MGLSSWEVISADDSLNLYSQQVQLDNISKPKPKPASAPMKCPRCDSTDTKFCYYNNYSRTQPRHLCRACKRHWTAGGTLRKVPVGGGGSRKNKRARTDHGETADDSDRRQLPFDLSQVLSLPHLLPPTPMMLLPSDYSSIESSSIALSCSQYEGLGLRDQLPELSLSYWNCWDGGLTELGIQDAEGLK